MRSKLLPYIIPLGWSLICYAWVGWRGAVIAAATPGFFAFYCIWQDYE